MRKSLLLAASNLRRAKGQTIAIIALILLASAMMNLGLMLSLDYKRNFDRCHDRLHDGHVTLAIDGRREELLDFLTRTLEEDGDVTEFSCEDALSMVGSFAYNGGEVNTEFVILEKETALSRPVGRMEIVEEGAGKSGVYLPMLYGADGKIDLGDTMDINIGSHVMQYQVCGFLNSAMAGSHNCSMSALLLTADKYEELEESGYTPASTLVSVRIRDKEQSEGFEAALKNKVSAAYPTSRMLSNSYELVSTSRYISQMICSSVVNAMAFFVALIAMVVISSNVINYIQESMKNLGAMKAIGYRSGQIVAGLLVQFLGVAVVTTAAGIGLSYCLFPSVNQMMIAQTGIPYRMRFQPLSCVMTVAACGGAVALSVWLSSRRIRKIEPIVALRQGVLPHSFKRNHVELEGTRAPLQLALALKTCLSGMKQNVTVGITMLVLSLVVVFSVLMVENVIVDMTPFINLIVGETADACVNVNPGAEAALLQAAEEDGSVEKIYLYSSTEVCHVGGSALMATMAEDFSQVNNQDVCYQGRFPLYDNEVAIGAKYAKEQELRIGDEIALTAEGKEVDYLICGFTQISNNLGKDCLLTREGFERMGAFNNMSYYVNLVPGADNKAFRERMEERLGSDLNMTIDIASVIEGSAGVYVSLMAVIVVGILVLGVAVIAFVLYLLVRLSLGRRKREYGILKALGFTTGQLVLQTAASFLPAVLLSTVTGIAVSAAIINPVVALFLGGIGIVKCTFTVPLGWTILSGAGLVLTAFGLACLLSLRIRKIAPVALLAGE